MKINIFYLAVQVSVIYALALLLCDVAGKLKETATEMMIELVTLQHLQGPWYTFLPYETILLKPQPEPKFKMKFPCSSMGMK